VKAVKQWSDELLDDPDRLRLARLLEEHPHAAADRRRRANAFPI
jgi:hypothetical protein